MAGGGVGEAMAIGALMGAGVGGVSSAVQDKDPLQGALLGAVTGAATGAAGSAIGGAVTPAATAPVDATIGSAVSGGTTGAVGGATGAAGGSGLTGVGDVLATGGVQGGAAGVTGTAGAGAGGAGAGGSGVGNWMSQGAGEGFAKGLTNAKAFGAGVGGGIGGLYAAGNVPGKQEWPGEEEYSGPLSYFKYDPAKYKADQPTPNVYEARYANGGIANLSETSPMSNTVYPQSQQTQTAFSSSPQYPSSMRSAMAADYDARTNPMYGTEIPPGYADGGIASLGGYSDGGRLLKGPGDGVSDSIPASIGGRQPARLADGEFVVPSRIVSELGNGSTDAGARRLYDMMDRVQARRSKTMGKGKVAKNTRAYKELPA